MKRTITVYNHMRHFFPLRAVACFLAAAAVMFPAALPVHAAARETLSLRFLRAVHVMRTLYPGDHWPAVSVPRRVSTDDTTNALIKHNDPSLVLDVVAGNLVAAEACGKYPQAGYYAAQALSRLGEHAAAAGAMKRFLAKAPFRERDYVFLVKELYAAEDYPGVREAAGVWQTLAASADTCSETRLMYVWGSYYATGRHREAMEAVLSDPCASWMGQIFFARSSLALHNEEGAEKRLAAVLEAYPEKEREIRMLWNRLVATNKYP